MIQKIVRSSDFSRDDMNNIEKAQGEERIRLLRKKIRIETIKEQSGISPCMVDKQERSNT